MIVRRPPRAEEQEFSLSAHRIPATAERSAPQFTALRFERFEHPRLLTVTWTGGGGNDLWSEANNWSTGDVPSSTDNVQINAAGSPTIIVSGSVSVQSLNSSDPIDVTSGSLTVTAGTSSLTDGLTIASGTSLTATGSGTTFTATGSTVIDGASVYAQSGGSLTLVGVT